MLNTIAFSEPNSFYEELDSKIASLETVEIMFDSTLPIPDSELWKRLGRCKGWSQLILVDYMQSRPEFSPPFGEVQAVAEFFPLVAHFFRFRVYRKYRLLSQEHQVGMARRILLRPK